MCKDHDLYYNPINPTTIFKPTDTKAECLTTVTINNTIALKWFYRSNSSKAWISCYNWSEQALFTGEYHYAGYLLIAGYWPGLNFPRAYKVEVYLDGLLSFLEFFEVTDGGLNSPRTCENVVDGYPVNMKSRFTIGTDTKVYFCLGFDNVAYFNEEKGDCHDFTTVWIQPNGTVYENLSRRFSDYKDTDITWNCWKHGSTNDTYILIDSGTPVGNWKVEVYIDEYYSNGTWVAYGPVSTTPFTVGSGPVAEWTFMVYLDGDNNLEPAVIQTFLNLSSVGSSAQVNIVVQFDRIGIDNSYGNWTDCKRFYVTKNMTPIPENAVQDLGEVDMGDPQTLRDFINWTMNDYVANRYFLVLWDHGAGFMGFCFDQTNGMDSLSLPKLSQALNGLPSVIDAALIDACGASMTEVAYQMKDYANVLIGPEELGYEPAPYNDYLESLTNDPSVSTQTVATQVITSYMKWCSSTLAIQNATMSAIDLTKITGLIAAIDDYALRLKETETLFHGQISLARSKAEEGIDRTYQGPYENEMGYCIDLYDFAQLTSQYVPDEELRRSADQLMAALSAGSTMIMYASKARPNWHGLAAFFPDANDKYRALKDAYEKTSFAVDALWNGFIRNDLSGCALTIQTSQPNVLLMLDNDSYAMDNGKISIFVLPGHHTLNVTDHISTGPGSLSLFSRWNDSDTSNPRDMLISGDISLTAEYQTKYRLLINGKAGTTTPAAGEHWPDAGSTVIIDAAAPIATPGEQFVFLGWNGIGNGGYSGTENSVSITMNEPINETALWKHEYYLTVASLCGSPTPVSGWVEAGQPIMVSVTSPIPGPTGTQYACTGWNGTGSVSASGTTTFENLTMSQPSSISWNWKTQYRFTISTNPAGLSPQPKPSSIGPWYDEGTLLNCVAQNVSGKAFDYWTVKSLTTGQLSTYERGSSQINVTIDGPYEAVAYYVPAPTSWDVLLRPENLQIILLTGGTLSVSIVGAVLIRTRRRKDRVKPIAHPVIKGPTVTLPGRTATGYADLDSLLLGGIPETYAVTLTSSSCDEADLLIKKFLEAGIRRGEVTFCITTDPGGVKPLAEEFQSNFYLFICNPRANTMIGDLPNVFKLNGVENLTDINIALTKAFRTLDTQPKGPRRACVEIISDVLLQHHAVQTRRWLADLIPDLRSKGFTTLALINPQMHPSQEVQAILDLFEGEISIYERETEGLEKFLKIRRMSNQKYVDSELPLRKERLDR
jgi:KaiC/GvpD/RAD55 family RecA-like ATPase